MVYGVRDQALKCGRDQGSNLSEQGSGAFEVRIKDQLSFLRAMFLTLSVSNDIDLFYLHSSCCELPGEANLDGVGLPVVRKPAFISTCTLKTFSHLHF